MLSSSTPSGTVPGTSVSVMFGALVVKAIVWLQSPAPFQVAVLAEEPSPFVSRQDIDLPHHVSMRAETTPPAGVPPAAWFVPLGAVGTGLSRVVLVDQRHGHAFRFRLVGDA